jgi:alkylhydroperoxidase/carboxymuconolactone decarboxylase family protein YurZ
MTNISQSSELPGAAGRVAHEKPKLWQALQDMGEAANCAGPLDERTRRLVNLAFAIAADSEGATHSHTRRALSEGLSADELHHVAYLAITTLGWPHAIRGLTWIQDLTRPET